MNKLYSKIAALSVGLAMAIGVGVAVGGKEAKAVLAEDVVEYTLDGTKAGSGNTYNGDNTATQDDVSWTINGNLTMNPWRIGGNKNNGTETGVDRYAYSNSTVSSEDITKVVFTAGTVSITVNSFKLIVSTDKKGGGTVVDELSGIITASSTTTFTKPSGHDWANKYFTFVFSVTNSTTSTKYIQFSKAEFFRESSTPRGELEIVNLSSPVINIGDSAQLSYNWTPASGTSATIVSHSWTSSNEEVLSVTGDNYSAVAPGVVTLMLTATDSNNEQYSSQSNNIYVSKEYSFEVGDNVALYSSEVSIELSGISTTSTKYGTGVSYSEQPNGVFALTVDEGTEPGSFAFKNGVDYLTWSSGNSLDKSSTKSINTSWYVVEHDDHMDIYNAKTSTRQILWNNGSPRFACYEGVGTNKLVSLAVLEDVPVRGTIAITAPTETLLRQGASATATFSWTAPEEAPSTTIASHTWTSSDTAVFSVSGDTYTAVGPGKAKLTLNATDSNGEEYTASTKDITVVGVVYGSYEKVYNVSVGDTVAIVCEADGTQLSGVANKIGSYVFYEDAPDSVFDFELEEGSVEGSFALKSSEDTYLAWIKEGAADIGLVEDVSERSSWTIEFENGNAKITNCALDGDSHRFIAWNHSSPRFAAYKGQTAVQLYAPAIELDSTAVAFANKIISDITCNATGKTKPSASAWSTLEGQYASVSEKGKEQLAEIFAVHHEEPSTDKEIVEEALAKYDYIVGKYFVTGLDTSFTDFIGRNPSPVSGGAIQRFDMNEDNNTMIIVLSIAAVSALAFTTLLVFKKKKQK